MHLLPLARVFVRREPGTWGAMFPGKTMAKSASVTELNPRSEAKPQSTRAPRKRKDPQTSAALGKAKSNTKPLLIGLGVGAAVAATALITASQVQQRSRRSSTAPSVSGMLAKAALFAVARLALQHAGRLVAAKASVKVAELWPERQAELQPLLSRLAGLRE